MVSLQNVHPKCLKKTSMTFCLLANSAKSSPLLVENSINLFLSQNYKQVILMIVCTAMSKLRLIHWFFIWLGVMFLLVIVTQPDQRPDKLEAEGFATTQSSRMYFQNIRSFYYLKSEEGGGMLEAYRLKSLFETTEAPVIPFIIYQNTLSGEAFIRVDTAFVDHRYSQIQIEMDTMRMVLPFPDADQESQYEFGKAVYKVLRDDGTLFFLSEAGEGIAIEGQQKIQLKMTLTDYFRLLDKL
jgi:hypothetical protein